MLTNLLAWHRGKLLLLLVAIVGSAYLAGRYQSPAAFGVLFACWALGSSICLREIRRRLRADPAGYVLCPECKDVPLRRAPLTWFGWCPRCQRHYQIEPKR